MSPRFRTAVAVFAATLFSAALFAPPASQAQAVASIRRVQVLHGGAQTEIEIESTAPIVPQTNELTGPYRLLVDFVKATPSAALRGQAVNRAEVKDLRVLITPVLELRIGLSIRSDKCRRGHSEHIQRELLIVHQLGARNIHELDAHTHEADVINVRGYVWSRAGEAHPCRKRPRR